MALMTRSGMNKILRRIMETAGMTDEMETDIKRLQDDFDEREGYLKSYGEVYDGEDKDEYDYTGKTTEIEGNEDFKKKYDELRQKYLDRFFGGVETKVEDNKGEGETEEVKDDEEQTIDDLFKKKGE